MIAIMLMTMMTGCKITIEKRWNEPKTNVFERIPPADNFENKNGDRYGW